MEIRDSINIEGRRMTVASLLSESFVYEASDLTSHGVSIDMTENGVVTIKVDGSINSSYKKEVVESGIIDSCIEKLHQKYIAAYEKLTAYYYKMYIKPSKVRQESEIRSLINQLECKKYTEEPFELNKPELSEIESDLKTEAEGEGLETEAEVEKYIASHIEDSYNYRVLKWEQLKKYHDEIQKIVAVASNKKYQEQYEIRKKGLFDIIEGDATYFKKKIKEAESNLVLPFSTDLEYVYSPEIGSLSIEFESPQTIILPQKKICISPNGVPEIVRTSSEENIINQTKCHLAVLFYIASSIWNITTRLKTISITNWILKDQLGLCWISFDRDSFARLDLDNINVIEACKNTKHVFDLKDYALQSIRYTLFNDSIKKGRYDIGTLLKDLNIINSIERKPYKKDDVEKLQIHSTNTNPSINDQDCGYDMSVRPDFDFFFANWCYKLIEYEKCSLSLFVNTFKMSINDAKEYMGKLIYVHFVGEKLGDGERKVLVRTERELEFKLSGYYPNESWRY